MQTPAPVARLTALIVDDEEPILDFLEMGLEMESFQVLRACSGSMALQLFQQHSVDAVILDIMLPDFDGLEVCRRIRSISEVPIMMLTARVDLEDRVQGLDTGADDYLSKPFKMKELQARLRALLRRSGKYSGKCLAVGDLLLNRDTREFSKGGVPIAFTAREFEILELLMSRPRQVFTRDQILSQIWGFDYDGETNIVEVHLRSVRKKLGDQDRSTIRAVRGVGYAIGGTL
jgi:DNA-binding response OmpR family regulator